VLRPLEQCVSLEKRGRAGVTVLGRQDLIILPCIMSLPGSGSRENIIHERKRTEGSRSGMRRYHLEETPPDVLGSGLPALHLSDHVTLCAAKGGGGLQPCEAPESYRIAMQGRTLDVGSIAKDVPA
jgi:hypothetical protein